MTDRVLPHDLDAERALLGGIVVDNLRLNDACEHVQPQHFYRAAHQRIFAAMVDLGERREPIDLVTLKNELGKDLELVGGAAYLAGILDGVPRSLNVGQYARIVRRTANLRQMIQTCQRLVAKAYESKDETDELLEEAERAILGLADRTTADGFEPMQAVAMRGMERLEHAHKTRRLITGVPSGFRVLDEMTRGFQPGTLNVIAARPGVGKTALATNICVNAASAGKVVANFSLEMSNDELFVRQLAAVARIDSQRIQTGHIGSNEWARLSQAVAKLAQLTIYSDETPAIAVYALRSRLRRLKAERGLDLVVIDYLQLLTTGQRRETRALEIAGITQGLKSLARELNVPILLLAQLNREATKDTGRDARPRLSHLKDSGSIEQDADLVLLLYRDETPKDESILPDGGLVVEVIVAKHRNGPTGTIRLAWYDQHTRFAEIRDERDGHREYVDRRLPIGDR